MSREVSNGISSTEHTKLLTIAAENDSATGSLYYLRKQLVVGAVTTAAVLLLCTSPSSPLSFLEWSQRNKIESSKPVRFPETFIWGVATSSYQIEGAIDEGGRGKTIWDNFCHQGIHISDNSTGDVACDHYHRMKEDVAMMKQLNIEAYRFSIAWSRILPNGTGGVNQAGVDFYNDLIDTLVGHGIEPWVTLYHWDLPEALQVKYGGWLDPRIVDVFAEYAQVCFLAFGDRVKNWITINEAWTVSVNGFSTGIHAPGHLSSTEPYLVGHHLLLAHSKAASIYKSFFQLRQKGRIGIANCGDFRYPRTDRPEDREAAERAMLFQFGWFTDPLLLGDYPPIMRQLLGDRLPSFTEDNRAELVNSTDFIGLNYYSSFLASKPAFKTADNSYWADMYVDFSGDAKWTTNDMGWYVVPDGLREMLLWISKRYRNPLLFITENGTAEKDDNLELVKQDERRRVFFESHLRACYDAIVQGVSLGGYFAWSLMDNFEWQFGYTRRFGLCSVNFQTMERTPKMSGQWYGATALANGANIDIENGGNKNWQHRRLLPASKYGRRVEIPKRVLIGYGSNMDMVKEAVYNGVNIVVWSFISIIPNRGGALQKARARNFNVVGSVSNAGAVLVTKLNLTALTLLIEDLSQNGFGDVVHLASIGGWNGGHLSPLVSAREWWITFSEAAGFIFDGIDWDLEGDDFLSSPSNVFAIDCLDKMGHISQLASEENYIVTMAPPQSYLDVDGNGRFSRYLNLTDPTRSWHNKFSHFGANAYAYLLARFGDSIDLISVQFYESYSRIAMATFNSGTSPAISIAQYVTQLLEMDSKYLVKFSSDPNLVITNQLVSIPLSKLVLGFANGWALEEANLQKVFFAPIDHVQWAWSTLLTKNCTPRGFMFWTIDEEGKNGIKLAAGLRRVLDIKP